MKQDKAGKPNNVCGRVGKQGFTWPELLILTIVSIAFLLAFFPEVIIHRHSRERARRVNCLSNQNGLWKAASQWGLDPVQTWRPAFPDTNLAPALALDNAGITPEIFICPGAVISNNSWGIYTATNMASVRAGNCNYVIFGGRKAKDETLVLIADKNGSNNIPSPTAWGGNHNGQGGNVVKVGGQGYWVSSPLKGKDLVYYITDTNVIDAFTNTGTVYSY